MESTVQRDFLMRAASAAKAANHVWPEYAACEAALESGWGQSKLATEANNLFGRKQSVDEPVFQTLAMPTREFLHGEMVPVMAHWVKYPDWDMCFRDRMALLRRLHRYDGALAAANGEDFVRLVSMQWSTDPARADKVMGIFRAHLADLPTA